LNVSSKNASGTEIRKSGSAIGAVDAVLLRWKYGGGDWSDDEARDEHSWVRDKRVGIVGMTAYRWI